jgi:hypothetical protein
MGQLKRQKSLELPELTKEEVVAIKCMENGTANDIQQKLAIDVIRKKLCMIGGLEFDVDERLSAFNGGKRLVGLQLNYLIAEPLDKILPPKQPRKHLKGDAR